MLLNSNIVSVENRFLTSSAFVATIKLCWSHRDDVCDDMCSYSESFGTAVLEDQRTHVGVLSKRKNTVNAQAETTTDKTMKFSSQIDVRVCKHGYVSRDESILVEFGRPDEVCSTRAHDDCVTCEGKFSDYTGNDTCVRACVSWSWDDRTSVQLRACLDFPRQGILLHCLRVEGQLIGNVVVR